MGSWKRSLLKEKNVPRLVMRPAMRGPARFAAAKRARHGEAAARRKETLRPDLPAASSFIRTVTVGPRMDAALSAASHWVC
jgi:hypothetical protein